MSILLLAIAVFFIWIYVQMLEKRITALEEKCTDYGDYGPPYDLSNKKGLHR